LVSFRGRVWVQCKKEKMPSDTVIHDYIAGAIGGKSFLQVRDSPLYC